MNFLASLAKIGQVAVQNAPAGGARRRQQDAPGCTPCAALGAVAENANFVSKYSPRAARAKAAKRAATKR